VVPSAFRCWQSTSPSPKPPGSAARGGPRWRAPPLTLPTKSPSRCGLGEELALEEDAVGGAVVAGGAALGGPAVGGAGQVAVCRVGAGGVFLSLPAPAPLPPLLPLLRLLCAGSSWCRSACSQAARRPRRSCGGYSPPCARAST
jgi:hypothetical protein